MADATESDEQGDAVSESNESFDVDLLDADEEFPEDFDEEDLDDPLGAALEDELEEADLAEDDAEDDAVEAPEPDGLALDEASAAAIDDEVEAVREGEFVCSSCHMAKRESALADPDEMLCRDCV